jgi:lipopolysaccharide/colanic/teichoic acid biosynthesis glycosyltransferase
MKLFHVTTIPLSLQFLRGQVTFMRSQGFEVHAVSSPGEALYEFGASEGILTHEVRMVRTTSPVRDSQSLALMVALFRRERPSIVHAHTPKAGLLAMMAARFLGVRCRIFTIHGLPHTTKGGLARIALAWSTKVSCALASRVFAVSQSVAELAIADGLCARENIHVIVSGSINGVDAVHKFSPDQLLRDKQRVSLGFGSEAVVLGFVGRLVRDKGVCELYESWNMIRAEFPNAYLVIAGDPEERDAVPDEVLRALRSDPRVRMLGWVTDLPPVYAALDVLVLPSHREGFGNVILEAAAMEIPSVATRITGCVDAIVDGVTGLLVPPRDSVALAEAIRKYLTDPGLRAEHRRQARARVLRDFRPETIWQATLNEYRRALAQVARPRVRRDLARIGKRAMDISVSLLALAILLPVLPVVAALVRIRMGSPVLFRQRRPGLNGQLFELLKFRTMRDAKDGNGNPLPDSERLTALGRFLRKTSLDEIPEFWNVLKGDMSLVGPRPLLPEYLPRYNDFQQRRHEVKPGLTGWAQVNGRNGLSWDERFQHDVWYVDNASFLLDLKILWLTARTVFSQDGVSQPGHATMPEFIGSSHEARS